MRHIPFKVSRAMLLRVAADVLMVNTALVAALVIRLLWSVQAGPIDLISLEADYQRIYLHNFLPLTLLCLTVFSISGFYTYSRAYQGRYKALVISQAVLQSYLIYAVITYFFWDGLGLEHIPRGAMVVAGILNLGMALCSRTWTWLWEKVVRPEREAKLRDNGREVKNVLVIGGAGYIGSALLPKLLKGGYRVRVLDMFIYGREPIESVADHPNLELVKGDFRHVESVVQAMRDQDAVIHLGAIVGDPACDLDQQLTVDVNLSATQMIAQVAKASGIRRFIFASTCSVYGACDELLDERSEVKPISLYGRTKLAAEIGLQRMADEKFTPTIVRFATIYGLSGRTRFDLVVNLLSAKAKADGQITVHGGAQWRPFVHVDDAALGVFQLLKAPLSQVGNETFNVGSDDQNYTIEEVGKLIHDHVIGSELILNQDCVDKRNYRVSFKKIHEKIGYHPQWTLIDGVKQVVEAVSSGHVEDYQDPRYSNVKYLAEKDMINVIRVDDDWSRDLKPAEELEVTSSTK